MSEFSASEAALEGFRVVRRHWRVVAGWAGFNLLALVMMVVVTVVLLLVLTAVLGQEQQAGYLGGAIGTLGTLLAEVVVVTGLYRLLLRPQEPAFLHLRLGRDEIRLFAIWLIWAVAVGLLAAGVVGIGAAAGAWGVRVAATLAAVVALAYLALRFCLVGPISFVERRIDFARSWRLTRGHTLALLGMAILAACLIGIVVLGAWVVLFLVAGLTNGFQGLADLASGTEALQEHPVRYLLELAAQILFTPVLWVLSQAPLVAAYRALADVPEA